MKKQLVTMGIAIAFLSQTSYAVECSELLSHYKRVPDPTVKTMRQLKRWVKRKIKDGHQKEVEECLIAHAADNPNQATVAGQ